MNKILTVKILTFALLFAAGNLISQNEYNFKYSFNETALVSGSSAGLSISASLGGSIVGAVSSESKTVRVRSANYFIGINGITAADNMEAIAPEAYQLKQNYPNPFNPSTVIEFSVPEESFVSIVIYSVLGEKVAELVNEKKSAGTYKLIWNAQAAGGLPSGIYIYTMRSGNFFASKKLLLLK